MGSAGLVTGDIDPLAPLVELNGGAGEVDPFPLEEEGVSDFLNFRFVNVRPEEGVVWVDMGAFGVEEEKSPAVMVVGELGLDVNYRLG